MLSIFSLCCIQLMIPCYVTGKYLSKQYFYSQNFAMDDKKKKYKEFTLEPNKELLLWEKWIKIREDEVTNIAKKIKKPPADLVMNLCENVREKKEWKIALEHARINEKPDVRGTLWEQAWRLKQRCYWEPVYEVHRTNADLGCPSVIEHIGVPNYIQATELGVIGKPCRKPCDLLDADYKKYRSCKETELHKNILKVDPYRPAIGDLYIKGTKPKTPPKKLPPLPIISITETSNECIEGNLCNIYALRINNSVFVKEIPGQNVTYLRNIQNEKWHQTCSSWTYYFNVPVKKLGRSKIYLENLGTVSIRYCWKKIKRPIPFIPETFYEQVFFFCKNENILFPGQKRDLQLSFMAEKSDIFSEFWELSTYNICFFNTVTEKFIFNMYADSTEKIEKIKYDVDVLKRTIGSKILANFATEILNDIFEEVTSVQLQIYPYKNFLIERDMFIMKNPICFYHQTEVAKMNSLFNEMAPHDIWDLSIPSWREKMMNKEYDDRMKYYELLRNSHAKLLKPWFEGDDLLDQKYRVVKMLLGKLADSLDKEYLRITELFIVESGSQNNSEFFPTSNEDFNTAAIRNIFYLTAYERLATTIELCAGVLSSLDLNRWIEIDFCHT